MLRPAHGIAIGTAAPFGRLRGSCTSTYPRVTPGVELRIRHFHTIVAGSVAAAFVWTEAPRLMGSPLELGADMVNELPNQLSKLAGGDARAGREGRHLGFDTYAYPGDDVMRAWRHEDV